MLLLVLLALLLLHACLSSANEETALSVGCACLSGLCDEGYHGGGWVTFGRPSGGGWGTCRGAGGELAWSRGGSAEQQQRQLAGPSGRSHHHKLSGELFVPQLPFCGFGWGGGPAWHTARLAERSSPGRLSRLNFFPLKPGCSCLAFQKLACQRAHTGAYWHCLHRYLCTCRALLLALPPLHVPEYGFRHRPPVGPAALCVTRTLARRADCTALQDMTAVLSNCCSATMSFNPITAANIGKALARIAEAEGLQEDPALVKVGPPAPSCLGNR